MPSEKQERKQELPSSRRGRRARTDKNHVIDAWELKKREAITATPNNLGYRLVSALNEELFRNYHTKGVLVEGDLSRFVDDLAESGRLHEIALSRLYSDLAELERVIDNRASRFDADDPRDMKDLVSMELIAARDTLRRFAAPMIMKSLSDYYSLEKRPETSHTPPYTDNKCGTSTVPLEVSETSKTAFDTSRKRAPKRAKSELADPSQSPNAEVNRTKQQVNMRLEWGLKEKIEDYLKGSDVERNPWVEALIKRELENPTLKIK